MGLFKVKAKDASNSQYRAFIKELLVENPASDT
jgi:hypothetical protein